MASKSLKEDSVEDSNVRRTTRSGKLAVTPKVTRSTRQTRKQSQTLMEDDGNIELEPMAFELELGDIPMEEDILLGGGDVVMNENSNGLAHQLGQDEGGSIEDSAADESSVSNQGFLAVTEISAQSSGDIYDSSEFNAATLGAGDNAISFQSDPETVAESTVKLDSDISYDIKNSESIGNVGDVKNVENIEETIIADVEDQTFVKEESSENKIVKDIIGVDANNDKNEIFDEVVIGGDANNEKNELFHEVVIVGNDGNNDKNELFDEVVTEGDDGNNDKNELFDEVTKKAENLDEDTAGDEAVIDTKDQQQRQKEQEEKESTVEETEVVSEDELPQVEKPRVQDAENVSDDELPGPKPADLPADTEVVSEDELPSTAAKKDVKEVEEIKNRKRKPDDTKDANYDPGSPTSEPESSTKKQAVAKNGESKPQAVEKRPSIDDKPKKKVLPELDKYWKAVNDDATDFTGWTYLLQYVDQESDVEAAREAYDAFLSHYPYCYGYWRKYADYEKRKGSKKKCLEVLERGLRAIPLSVDLWIHYLNHIRATRADDKDFIRAQCERAVAACGLEFRSDRLWESYIKWEAENGSAINVTAIYDRLLATPTLGYTAHFDGFQEHITSHPANKTVPLEDFVKLRSEVREVSGPIAPADADIPPGEEESDDHIRSEEEGNAIKEKIISIRRKVHKATGEQVAHRWSFEEGIKRPYFHVKPLERCQLKNWKAYLEWEQQNGGIKRALVLHERCLIACALYEEYWLRLVRYLEEKAEEDPSIIATTRDALERACTVHHLDKPTLHMHWAYFEERHGNAAKASEILERLEKTCPNLLQIAYRRINLERRRGDFEKCVQLYESYIASAKNKAIASCLSVKYARFLHKVRGDLGGGLRVLAEAVVKEPLNTRLYLQQLDMALQAPNADFDKASSYLEAYLSQEGADADSKLAFAARRAELAEELGSSAAAAQRAHEAHRSLARAHRKLRRKQAAPLAPASATAVAASESTASTNTKKKEASNSTPAPQAASSTNTNQAPPYSSNYNAAGYYAPPPHHAPHAAAPAYDQSYQQQPGYQAPWGQYQQHPPNPYQQHPWGQYPNYY